MNNEELLDRILKRKKRDKAKYLSLNEFRLKRIPEEVFEITSPDDNLQAVFDYLIGK